MSLPIKISAGTIPPKIITFKKGLFNYLFCVCTGLKSENHILVQLFLKKMDLTYYVTNYYYYSLLMTTTINTIIDYFDFLKKC